MGSLVNLTTVCGVSSLNEIHVNFQVRMSSLVLDCHKDLKDFFFSKYCCFILILFTTIGQYLTKNQASSSPLHIAANRLVIAMFLQCNLNVIIMISSFRQKIINYSC